ncbi:hypothetical protein [Merismopedia glauca]|uniref:Uncharacterized protein n=1 Tax=Merismopedia glauca CCAP 1448/3 TaxID=1296344 RepID=A0A2T1C1L7_9CYAN|nr:hypothetical protein [Merismopedia glauca]PSB02170.1 hypothetical protein C7B64_14410 [Merismopedia glauca CCAP 1448/3]
MTYNLFSLKVKPIKTPQQLWLDRALVTLALLNLGLVFFDLSYIPWRRYYFGYTPIITKIYDPVKGIEPNQKTQSYINKVKELKVAILKSGLTSETSQKLFQELQVSSQQMLDADPFSIAQKTGMLDKIKNRMRQHMNRQSATVAFTKFWDAENFQAKSWQSEISFYETQIQPLIIANYFRNTDSDDEFVDRFFWIDLIFIAIFATDIIIRIYSIRRHLEITWFEAMRSRWYDLFLLLPFWQWLRIIPVIIRLHQSEFIDLSPIQKEIDRYIVRSLAETVTREVVIQILNQIQSQIKQVNIGEIIKDSLKKEYVDLNNVNEIKVISGLIFQIMIEDILPKLQPQIQALVQYNIQKIIFQMPPYQALAQIPGIGKLPGQLANQIIQETSGNAYQLILKNLKDPVGIKLSEELIDTLSAAIAEELQKKHTWHNIQILLGDMIEEIKINYIHNLSTTEIENLRQNPREN